MYNLYDSVYASLCEIVKKYELSTNEEVIKNNALLIIDNIMRDRGFVGASKGYDYDIDAVISSAEKNFSTTYDRTTNTWCPPTCKA